MKEKPNLIVFVFLGFIVLIIIFRICFQYIEQKDISLNKETTLGRIIEFDHLTSADYSIKYMYEVDEVEYYNHVGVSFFKCEDGKEGCVGSEFRVYYSSKNPEHSRIDLGKYEKYKTTVEFVK